MPLALKRLRFLEIHRHTLSIGLINASSVRQKRPSPSLSRPVEITRLKPLLAPPSDRLALVGWLSAVASIVAAVLLMALAVTSSHALPLRLLAGASLLWLAWRRANEYARAELFSPKWDLVEAGALFLAGSARGLGGALMLMFVGQCFRCLFGADGRVLVGTLLYATAYMSAATVFEGAPPSTGLTHVAGVALMAGTIRVILPRRDSGPAQRAEASVWWANTDWISSSRLPAIPMRLGVRLHAWYATASASWRVYLVLGCLAGLCLPFLSPPVRYLCLASIGAYAVLAGLVGMRRHRPPRSIIWSLFTGSQLALAIGALAAGLMAPDSQDSLLAGVVRSVAYALLIAGLALLVRDKALMRDRADTVDTAMVMIAASLQAWLFVMNFRDGGASSVPHLLASWSNLLLLLALLATAVRWLLAPGPMTISQRLLQAGMIFLLASQTLGAIVAVVGLGHGSRLPDVTLAVGFLLIGSAALDPSMRSLAQPVPVLERQLSLRRLGLLALTLLSPAAVLTVQGALSDRIDVLVIVAGWLLLLLLFVARTAGVVRDLLAANSRSLSATMRESLLRTASVDMSLADSSEAVRAVALKAAEAMGGNAGDVWAGIASCSGDGPCHVTLSSRGGLSVSAEPLHLPEPLRQALSTGACVAVPVGAWPALALALDPAPEMVLAAPLLVDSQLDGAILLSM